MKYALVAAACVGHLALVIRSHNWWYGLPLSKRAGDAVHLLHALLVTALPAAAVAVFGWRLTDVLHWHRVGGFSHLLQAYLAFCLLVAFVWLPFVTFVRLFRREPARLVRCEVVDVARQLGRRPVGSGHHAFLAGLPGNELFEVEYVEKVLYPARLPAAWDGLTILHLTDLHLHGTPDRDWFRVILDRCAAWSPELVAVTGDVADSDVHHRWIIPLLGRLRWRVAAFAILGNHDHRHDVGLIRKRLRRLGMRVLENDCHEVEVRGEKLLVAGHEGPWLPGEPDLSAYPAEAFRLCLSHTPDNVGWARRHGVDLMLAGHLHGGQIRLWPFGSILVPSRCGRRFDAGTFHEPPTLVHVSRGLSGEHPVRYNCRPEVTLLTLRRPARRLPGGLFRGGFLPGNPSCFSLS
jgi:predicted MPP superfamily phosphohydrolase